MENTIKTTGSGIGEVESSGLDNLANGTSQVGIGVLAALAAMIGIWGAACLIGGILKSGGVVEMARGFISAIIG